MSPYVFPGLRSYDPDAIVSEICTRFGVTTAELRGPSRKAPIVQARHEAIRELYNTGTKVKKIATIINRDLSTVKKIAYIKRRIEKL